MYLKLSSSLLPPGRLRSILESGWDETGCVSAQMCIRDRSNVGFSNVGKSNIGGCPPLVAASGSRGCGCSYMT